jgi:hypothetical protein
MVNLLIATFLSGIAVTFAIELLDILLGLFFEKEMVYKILSLPLSFGALTCFFKIEKEFLVLVPATAFIVLILNKVINKPAVFTADRRQLPRLGA